MIAYALVIAEEFIHMRKSKPVIFAAGVIWVLVAVVVKQVEGGSALVEHAVDHNLKVFSTPAFPSDCDDLHQCHDGSEYLRGPSAHFLFGKD